MCRAHEGPLHKTKILLLLISGTAENMGFLCPFFSSFLFFLAWICYSFKIERTESGVCGEVLNRWHVWEEDMGERAIELTMGAVGSTRKTEPGEGWDIKEKYQLLHYGALYLTGVGEQQSLDTPRSSTKCWSLGPFFFCLDFLYVKLEGKAKILLRGAIVNRTKYCW